MPPQLNCCVSSGSSVRDRHLCGPGWRTQRVVALERVAVNLVDAHIPDNAGQQPYNQPVVAGAPATLLLSTVTDILKALGDRLADQAHPTAGPFVCNHVCFTTG
jgi:pyrrolidone-carboxylate peptidase